MEQYQRCECHECTQARWKMSMEGQMDRIFWNSMTRPPVIGEPVVTSTPPKEATS
jgi:hypothetical protein